jgi:hypothetical protein
VNGPVTYYAVVHKFLKITLNNLAYRLAIISSYPNDAPTAFGIPVLRPNPYRSDKVVGVVSFERKVIFTPSAPGVPTKVLKVPVQSSH